MMRIILLIIVLFISCKQSVSNENRLVIDTDFGNIEIELYPDKAPKSVAAFLSYVEAGYYKNGSFYRVLKADELPNDNNTGLIQGGRYTTNTGSVKLEGIPHESTHTSRLSHTDGTISLARTAPGTATTEFFICIGDQSPLDHGRRGTADGLGMAAFGKVIKGMDIVRMIQAQPVIGDRFKKNCTIRNIKKK
ncbi:MAG: peptidylprolyl isomerase [Ferruginibacter sp.]